MNQTDSGGHKIPRILFQTETPAMDAIRVPAEPVKWQPPALAGGRGVAGGFEAWTLWGEVSGSIVVDSGGGLPYRGLTESG